MVNADKLVDAANRKERRAIRRALKEEKSAIDAANKRARADEKRDSRAMAKRLAAGDVGRMKSKVAAMKNKLKGEKELVRRTKEADSKMRSKNRRYAKEAAEGKDAAEK